MAGLSPRLRAVDRSARAIEQVASTSGELMAAGRLSVRQVAVEELELEPGEAPYDLAFAVRVGALDGRYPEAGARRCGGWQAPFPDPVAGEFVTELNTHASAFLLGRRTFDIFRGYWPDQTDPDNEIATTINSKPKYVVSRSLNEADATWRGEHPDTARLVSGDVVEAIRALKDEPGDELQIWGSGDLLQTLLQHDLVDRFRLLTYPLVLGSGRRLFADGTVPVTMRAVELAVTDLGVVIGTYEPAGPVEAGEM